MSKFSSVKDFLYKVQKSKDSDNKTELKNESGNRKNVLDLKILVMVDVSGSISQHQYVQFMQQVNLIKGLSIIKVLETDTDVVALYDYVRSNKSRIARLGGGGGTAFGKAFRVAKDINPDAILFMTDGMVGDSVTNVKIPVGWVLTDGGAAPYNFGETVMMLPDV